MKNKHILTLVPLMSVVLSGCGGVKSWKDNLGDYEYTMEFHQNFNILQMTDIHWSVTSSTTLSRRYLQKVIEETDRKIKAEQGDNAKIDLIELTGDQFMLANTYHVKTFIKFFEEMAIEHGFMYTAIWGNHDRHGVYNPNWLSETFRQAEHCIYLEPEDDLYGRSNFVINLNQGGVTKWQLANLDSGASFSETAVSPFRDYDYIRKEQVDWWVAEHDRVGTSVPTIAYYHIPQQDNLEAWNKIHKDGAAYKHKFFKLEGFADNGNERYASQFIKVGRENGLKAAFMGHAHNVDWTVDYDGVVIGLGVKTGTELYYAHIDVGSTDEAMAEGVASIGATENFDLIGASLVTIKDDANFDLEHLYLNERTGGDFVRWVKW